MAAAVLTMEPPSQRQAKLPHRKANTEMTPHEDWHLVDDIFQRLNASLRSFFAQTVPDEDDIDDLLAETRLKMEEHRAEWHPQVATNTWIRAFARNVLRAYRRNFAKRQRVCQEHFAGSRPYRKGSEPPQRLLQGGRPMAEDDGRADDPAAWPRETVLHELMWNCVPEVEELSSRYRSFLALHLALVPKDAVMRCFGISTQLLYKRHQRGRQRLQALLDRHPLHPANANTDMVPLVSADESALLREIWDWIWSLPEDEGRTVRLLLFGRVGLRVIHRLRLCVDVDIAKIEAFEAKLDTLAQSKLKQPPA